MKSLPLALALFAVSFSRHAVAQPICVDGSPASDQCSAPAAAPAPTQPEDLAEQPGNTYDVVLPNGNLTPAGRVHVGVHSFGVYNTVAYGVTDRVEINAGIPIIPLFASFGARVALTPPSSRVRVVLGASAWAQLIGDTNDRDWLPQLTATVAYHADRFEVHGTLGGIFENTDTLAAPMANIGASYQTSPRYRLFADYASVNVSRVEPSNNNPTINILVAGVKYIRKDWTTDLALLVASEVGEDGESTAAPMVSFQRLY